jgi:hypothetical protein
MEDGGGKEKGYSFKQLSYDTIGACIDVQRQLGVHCMEVDYQHALEIARPKRELGYQREVEIPIAYDGVDRALAAPVHGPPPARG